MSAAASTPDGTLAGWTVLVPRSGPIGDRLAAAVTRHGGSPIAAPLIDIADPVDGAAFDAACARLAAGEFDWVAVTSAATVDALVQRRAAIPEDTRVAAVGDATGAALTAAGYRVDFVPEGDHSAAGLVAQWPAPGARVLLPQSERADPFLADRLAPLCERVETVTAYRIVPVPAERDVIELVASGGIRAIVLTAGSIAGEVVAQFPDLPAETVVACIGGSTAAAAHAAGLPVHVVAAQANAAALIDALADFAAGDSPISQIVR